MIKGTLEPAKLYLQLEFENLLPGAEEQVKALLATQDRAGESYHTFRLLNAISGSLRLNLVTYFLSNSKYSWTLEDVSLDDFVLTGMAPDINVFIIEKAEKVPSKLAELWKINSEAKAILKKHGVRSELDNPYPPLLACEDVIGGKLRTFDGMHRLLAAAISGRATIKAWVGRITDPAGKPFVSPELVYGLITLHRIYDKSDTAFDSALQAVAKAYLETFPNAFEVLEYQLAGTKKDSPIRAVFQPIIDSYKIK